MGLRLDGHQCPFNAKFHTFSVKISVFKTFTSVTVFCIKSPNFQYQVTSGIYTVLTSGFQKHENLRSTTDC